MDFHCAFHHKIKVSLIFWFSFCKGLIIAVEMLLINSQNLHESVFLSCFHSFLMMLLKKYITLTDILNLEVSEQTLEVSPCISSAWFNFHSIGWRTEGIMQPIGLFSGFVFSNIRCVQSLNTTSGSLYLDFLKNRWMTLIRLSITCVQE